MKSEGIVAMKFDEVVEKVCRSLSRECNHVKGRFRKNRL